MESIVETAYHEAGHAFMCYVLGKGFNKVTVVPFEDYLGAVTNLSDRGFLQSLITGVSLFSIPQSVVDFRVKNELMILYAGYLAEKEYGVDNEPGAYSDLETINDFIKHYCVDEDESICLIDYCKNTALNILTENWLQIKLLANELLNRDTMSYAEVDDYFKSIEKMSLSEMHILQLSLK